MPHTLSELMKYSVHSTDGEIGSVRNFLFDDSTWEIRYLVVNVGSWLERRDVVLAISAVEQPNRENKTFNVRMTKDQVRDSPDVDSEKPVSRQQEIAMEKYFGKMATWVNDNLEWGAPTPTGRKYPVHTKEDPHLRSARALFEYEICGTDGEIGRLESFILDDATWHIGYLEVKAGKWLLDRTVLIPTRWIESVSWDNCRVNLHHSRNGLETDLQTEVASS
jgi:sporulation protein YlmC with PRC-barrel domain